MGRVDNVTRAAVDPNNLTTANLKSFGVFTFYSEGITANGAIAAGDLPNFMFNQKVTGGTGAYTYTPVKYWPNQDGVSTNGSEPYQDVLSFYAYAPYVGLNDGTDATTATANGISLSDGTTTYANNTPWGTGSGQSYPKIYYNPNTTNYTKNIDLLYATPLENQVKGTVTSKVSLAFKHAMTQIGQTVNIRYLNDKVNSGGTTGDAVDGTTKVTLQEVYIWIEAGTNTLLTKGWLNLKTGEWTQGADGYSPAISSYTDAENVALGIKKTGGSFAGLTNDEVTNANLQLSDFTGFLMIPTYSDITIKAKVVYTVTTTDAALSGGSSVVSNDITNSMTLTPAAGKNYIINLVLGLTSLKLDATVTDWADSTPATEGEINLPNNTNP